MTMSGDKRFEFSDDNKRYHSYSYYLKHRFGGRVSRAAIDIGAGCPNRANGCGCIFCADGTAPLGRFTGIDGAELDRRLEAAMLSAAGKTPDKKFIAYLQSGSNTFGDPAEFERVYDRLLAHENVVGLAVATRADCIDERFADIFAKLHERTYLTVELGLQTADDGIALRCGRGHTRAQFLEGYHMLDERGINIGVHIINGLPEDTRAGMLETARFVASLKPHCVKIHMLYIERGTRISRLYECGQVKAMERDEYVSTVCDQLELLPPQTVIARLTGDGRRGRLIAPEWSLHKRQVLNEIDKEMARRGSFQGDRTPAEFKK